MIQDDGAIDLEMLRHSGFIDRDLPERLRQSSPDEATGLIITGDSYRAFRQALSSLESEDELEHLEPKDIDASLWDLCCELFLDREKYKTEQARRKRVSAYLHEVSKAHSDYEVIIALENAILESSFTVDGVTFERLTQESAKEWQRFSGDISSDLIDQPMALVTVRAGHVDRAVARAQTRVDEALDILRLGFRASIMIRVRDNELMIRQGEKQLVRAHGIGRWQKWSFNNRPNPTRLVENRLRLTLRYLQPLEHLLASQELSSKMKERIRLALHWLGTAAARRNHDEKVIDLCTAYESLLCEKSDGRKGELITLRSMLLQSAATGGFTDTFPLLRLYELRSSLVHGSAIGICGDAHYRFLVGDLLRLLEVEVKFLSEHPEIKAFRTFKKAIQTEELLEAARGWFFPFGEYSKDILAEIRAPLSGYPGLISNKCSGLRGHSYSSACTVAFKACPERDCSFIAS